MGDGRESGNTLCAVCRGDRRRLGARGSGRAGYVVPAGVDAAGGRKRPSDREDGAFWVPLFISLDHPGRVDRMIAPATEGLCHVL